MINNDIKHFIPAIAVLLVICISVSSTLTASNAELPASGTSVKDDDSNAKASIVKTKKENDVSAPSALDDINDEDFSGKTYKDGTYTGTGTGYAGKIKAQVKIKNNKIKNIKIVKHNEDQPYMNNAMSLIKNIVKNQNPDVDTVSGATYSSKGIINAVKDALSKAVTDKNKKYKKEKKPPKEEETVNYTPPPEDSDFVPVLGQYIDGTYIGKATGYCSVFTATVVIKNENIFSINIKHNDDLPYYNKCTWMIQRIIDRQTTEGIDTVTGCTKSSNGILNSVRGALKLAKKIDVETDSELANM